MPYVVAVVPTIVVAAFFYVIIKRMMEADRRERLAQSQFEAEQDRRQATRKDGPDDPARPVDSAQESHSEELP
ncbi:hypothetical protein H9L10_13275 [Phycicoccus endophyticus]|uniref:Uncharacterized protein n=1 Tax=Phycicoccus endophyticus TaxID=1690220 RepID=A0A7G9R0Q7_9MICO|nr:hypothetical protein [Phycicoccus endophyticus]NHI19469.1 hypothetical protein [Phycicoccus endophyticus]QNN49182.1 hypothetical protein H9L10_13275 [Phycicoccus endophyticus]